MTKIPKLQIETTIEEPEEDSMKLKLMDLYGDWIDTSYHSTLGKLKKSFSKIVEINVCGLRTFVVECNHNDNQFIFQQVRNEY